MVTRSEALELLARARRLEREVERNPLVGIAWLPGQLAFLSDPGPKPKLFRAGVRSGKTLAAVAEVIWRATGEHPYIDTPTPPVKLAIITTDKQVQGVAIQRLFYEHAPKHLLAPGTEFSNRTGFRGHVPLVEFTNGSTVTFLSANAGPQAFQGTEFHHIHLDEPPPYEVYQEARNRVLNTGGTLSLSLTPLNRAVPYLEELCAKGMVTDHHYPLTVANSTSPITGRIRETEEGVPWDADFIAAWRAEHEGNPARGIILDGDWERRSEGAFFDCFDTSRHVSDRLGASTVDLVLGVDYASADREHGMCAVLSAVYGVDEGDGERPDLRTHVHALAEVVMPGVATIEQFSREILEMLRASLGGIAWHELDAVYGDIPARARGEVSSNAQLRRWLERHLRARTGSLRPRIQNAKEGSGSSHRSRSALDMRCRWAYSALANGRVRVSPTCKHLIQGLETWDYGARHPSKDVLDAWMYGLKDTWSSRREQELLPRVRLG